MVLGGIKGSAKHCKALQLTKCYWTAQQSRMYGKAAQDRKKVKTIYGKQLPTYEELQWTLAAARYKGFCEVQQGTVKY